MQVNVHWEEMLTCDHRRQYIQLWCWWSERSCCWTDWTDDWLPELPGKERKRKER